MVFRELLGVRQGSANFIVKGDISALYSLKMFQEPQNVLQLRSSSHGSWATSSSLGGAFKATGAVTAVAEA